MIEITESGEVSYTNSRKEKGIVGTVLTDGITWRFSPVAGLHHKTQSHVQELLKEKFSVPNYDTWPSFTPEPEIDEEGPIDVVMTAIPEAPINPDEEPKQEPSMGDKTPAWMAWLKRTKPKEFAARYAGRTVNTEGI